MTTVLLNDKNNQSISIPETFRLDCKEVVVERLGDGLFIRPAKSSSWPNGYFEQLRISDEAFCRPEQGPLPEIAGWKV